MTLLLLTLTLTSAHVGICQHFMDARLIENAGDPASAIFKDKGEWARRDDEK